MKIKVSKIAFFTYVYFFESRLFNGLRPIQIEKFSWYLSSGRLRGGVRQLSAELALPHSDGFGQIGVLIVAPLSPGEGKRQLAQGGVESCPVAFGFGIEQPCGVIERRQVDSRSIDPCFVGGDRRRDLIPLRRRAEAMYIC
jgi:hypothetical protein